MTRTFAWHRIGLNARPYPVLWNGEIPAHPESEYHRVVVARHPLTEEDEAILAASNRGCLDVLAERYPSP